MGKFYILGFALAAVAAFYFFRSRKSSTDTFVDKALDFRDNAMSAAHHTFDKARDTVKV